MDEKYEERVSSILRGGAELSFQYPAISEFKDHLNEAGLSDVGLKHGWVLWRGKEQEFDLFEFHRHHSNYAAQLQYKIITLFKHIASDSCFCHHYLVQFWAVVRVEEEGHHLRRRRHYLSTSDQPFSVGNLTYALCRYRKLCTEREYDVEEGAKEDQLGGVGRAYRNKQPESTPDLRLYSADEFPLRDQVARCNLKGCLTLPLFDVHNTEECYGVVELISGTPIGAYQLSSLDTGLQGNSSCSESSRFFSELECLLLWQNRAVVLRNILACLSQTSSPFTDTLKIS